MVNRIIRRPLIVTAVLTTLLVWTDGLGMAPHPAIAPPSTLLATGPGELWMAPEPDAVFARLGLARAVSNLAAGRAGDALPVFSAAVSDPEIGPYARLYVARAYLALSRPADAATAIAEILAGAPSDALTESTLNLAVDADSAAGDARGAFEALKNLSARPNSTPVATEFRLLQAAIEVGDRATALTSFRKLFFEYPAAQESADAIEEMQRIGVARPLPSREDGLRHLARAEKLFLAARYSDARTVFAALEPILTDENRELVQLRLAECDLFLKKYPAAAAALRAYGAKASSRVPEADFHYLAAVKGLGRGTEYVSLVHEFVARHGQSAPELAERALNELGTYFILEDDDEQAAGVFAEQYSRYPQGAFADRAAWRAGWWAYKKGEFAEAIRIFDAASMAMRRADYRPAWLYWAARAHLKLGHRDAALEQFRRVIGDYRNSYYGRAAMEQAETILDALRPPGAGPVSPARLTWPAAIAPSPRPPNAPVIESLLAAGMYEEAIGELRGLQATGANSPLIEATLAYALNRQGKLRPAISAMRRAYPQFIAEGGEALPQEILTVIFPIDYWDELRAQAATRRLDPFLLAALVAQESTFQADIKSAANAWGLMQVVPATGRRYAASLGIRPFSTFRLVEPEINLRLGTAYFADLMKRFGDIPPALAAYNAGEQRVVRWLAERPGFERDEFIDDIPFPETQNYVKRILGTAEDYRILYGSRTH